MYNPPNKQITLIHISILILIFILVFSFFTWIRFEEKKELLITELMASNRAHIQDEDGEFPDWLEIHNPTGSPINLEGYWLSDDPGHPFQWLLPDITLEPGAYFYLFASGKNRADPDGPYLHTNFRISMDGDTIVLGSPGGEIIDKVSTGFIPSNISFGRVPVGRSYSRNEWAFFLDPTPGRINSSKPYEDVMGMPQADHDYQLYINEFITSNRTGIPDEDGDLHDWLELYNAGDDPVELYRYWLSDKWENPYKWRFPEVIIEPGEYKLIFASGKNRIDPEGSYLHTNFRLNDIDDELILKTPAGHIIDKKKIRNMVRNVSYGRANDDKETWLYFPHPTPRKPNYTQGFESLEEYPITGKGSLFINEVMAENTNTLQDNDGEYSAWIELYNSGEHPINLKGFGLSDKPDNPFRWVFPEVTIEAGQYRLVFASRKDRRDPANELHTNYQIQAAGETIVLTHASGKTIDSLHSGKLAPDMSRGRYPDGSDTAFFFIDPTPAETNSSKAFAGYAKIPIVSHAGGFYDNSITVSLKPGNPTPEDEEEAEKTIRYTLDGSEPTAESARYVEPINIKDNSVMRVRTFQTGKLPSPIVNRSFFVNEEQNLTVVSVLSDPEGLFDPEEGMHVMGPEAGDDFPYYDANFWQRIEVPVHLELYEPNGVLGYAFDLGMRIAGQFSRAMPQKSFNLFARNIYGYNEMRYPFFSNKPITRHKAITLRTSGQDAELTRIRDIMLTSLLDTTLVNYQGYRQAVLYLNGEYWGIYNIRERMNNHFIGNTYGLDPYSIDLLQGNGWVREGSRENYDDMVDYARYNDLSQAEHYEYMKTRMDVENYIDYWTTEVYLGQTDTANIRFWREQRSDAKWRWLKFDLDWAFYNVYHNTMDYITNPEGTGFAQNLNTDLLVNLMENSDFRAAFFDRLVFHFNVTFDPERVLERIDMLTEKIEPEMPRTLKRWKDKMRPKSMEEWYKEVEVLKDFAIRRQTIILPHIKNYFNANHDMMQAFEAWE